MNFEEQLDLIARGYIALEADEDRENKSSFAGLSRVERQRNTNRLGNVVKRLSQKNREYLEAEESHNQLYRLNQRQISEDMEQKVAEFLPNDEQIENIRVEVNRLATELVNPKRYRERLFDTYHQRYPEDSQLREGEWRGFGQQ